MSLLDGIVNAARSVFGMEPSSQGDAASRDARPAEQPVRGRNLAADTPTGFERTGAEVPVASDGISARIARRASSTPTLADRIASAQPLERQYGGYGGRNPAITMTLPPHLTGAREQAPPASTTGEQAPPSDAAASTVKTAARAYVYDNDGSARGDTVDTLMGSDDAAVAARNVQHGIDYYAETFGRDGLDGAGSGVNVIVNDRATDAEGNERFAGNGGYYATTYADGTVSEAIHFGRGKEYEGERGSVRQMAMLHADDLAIHELTHGIIRKETGHLGGDADEAGATNEAIADVMSAAATRDWRIGEGMYAAGSDYRLMRNIADPDDPTAVHGLWTSMEVVREKQQRGEEVEEHWASGVISTAAYRMQQRLGGEAGWQAVERVFYDTIDNGRLGDMSFTAVAAALRTSAAAVYGTGSSVAQVVDQELRRAGL